MDDKSLGGGGRVGWRVQAANHPRTIQMFYLGRLPFAKCHGVRLFANVRCCADSLPFLICISIGLKLKATWIEVAPGHRDFSRSQYIVKQHNQKMITRCCFLGFRGLAFLLAFMCIDDLSGTEIPPRF